MSPFNGEGRSGRLPRIARTAREKGGDFSLMHGEGVGTRESEGLFAGIGDIRGERQIAGERRAIRHVRPTQLPSGSSRQSEAFRALLAARSRKKNYPITARRLEPERLGRGKSDSAVCAVGGLARPRSSPPSRSARSQGPFAADSEQDACAAGGKRARRGERDGEGPPRRRAGTHRETRHARSARTQTVKPSGATSV